jgi:hypothetical protein
MTDYWRQIRLTCTRWPGAPIALVVIGIVGLVPVLAEVVVRDHFRGRVVEVAQRTLHTSTVTVDLGRAPMLVDLVTGRIPHIVITADEATVCRLTDVSMVAYLFDVSIEGKPEIGRSQVSITVGAQSIREAVLETTHLNISALALSTGDDGLIRLAIGADQRLTITMAATLDGNDIAFEITSMTVDGRPADSALAALDAAGQRHHSLAGLPLGLRPAGVSVNSTGLVVDLAGGSAALPTIGTASPCKE